MVADRDLSTGEFIFIIDRSGSMYGDRIKNARVALSSFLGELPPNTKFNVISYGSNHKWLYKEAKESTEDNIKGA